jgi:hypothetical protein
LLLFAHYRRQSKLGQGVTKLERSCARCCGCCFGARALEEDKLADEHDEVPPKTAGTARPVTPGSPGTPIETREVDRRSLEAGDGRQTLARHVRSASNTALRHNLGLALGGPATTVATLGRARRPPLAKPPQLDSLAEVTEPPSSARRTSAASATARRSHASAYEDAIEGPASASLDGERPGV